MRCKNCDKELPYEYTPCSAVIEPGCPVPCNFVDDETDGTKQAAETEETEE